MRVDRRENRREKNTIDVRERYRRTSDDFEGGKEMRMKYRCASKM